MSLEELPISYCWRCGSECDTEWLDVRAQGDREPHYIKGPNPCSNPRCVGRFDVCADTPPTPEQLRQRADECMERIHNTWSDGARSFLSDPTDGRQERSWLKRLIGRNRRAR